MNTLTNKNGIVEIKEGLDANILAKAEIINRNYPSINEKKNGLFELIDSKKSTYCKFWTLGDTAPDKILLTGSNYVTNMSFYYLNETASLIIFAKTGKPMVYAMVPFKSGEAGNKKLHVYVRQLTITENDTGTDKEWFVDELTSKNISTWAIDQLTKEKEISEYVTSIIMDISKIPANILDYFKKSIGVKPSDIKVNIFETLNKRIFSTISSDKYAKILKAAAAVWDHNSANVNTTPTPKKTTKAKAKKTTKTKTAEANLTTNNDDTTPGTVIPAPTSAPVNTVPAPPETKNSDGADFEVVTEKNKGTTTKDEPHDEHNTVPVDKDVVNELLDETII